MIDIDLNDLPVEDELPEGPDGETLEYDGIGIPEPGDLFLVKLDVGYDIGRSNGVFSSYHVLVTPEEPDTEEFRIETENEQVLVIRGPVRDIEPGEQFACVEKNAFDNWFYSPSITNQLERTKPPYEECGTTGEIYRIPASEASLRIEGQDDPFCSPGSCDHCDDLREQWEADEDES